MARLTLQLVSTYKLSTHNNAAMKILLIMSSLGDREWSLFLLKYTRQL